MIYETEYFIEVPAPKQNELPLNAMDASIERRVYCLQEQRETLVKQEGLYTAAALIINFFLSYPKNITLQHTVLTVFKRIYRGFPRFRKNLEDPVISVLINIQHKLTEL